VIISEKDRIRNKTTGMELGIIQLKQMIELAQLRWFGHGIKWGMRHIPKWPGKLQHGEETQMRTLTEFGKRDTEDFEGKRNSMARSESYSSRL
jgi:hypothetical protein